MTQARWRVWEHSLEREAGNGVEAGRSQVSLQKVVRMPVWLESKFL